MQSIKLGDVALQRVYELRKRQENPEAYRPVRVGLVDFEYIINSGLPRIDPFYCAIIGQDKKGKSTFGNQLAWSYCENTGYKGVLYNLEENLNQAADRAMAMMSTKVNRTNIYMNELTEEDLDALEFYAHAISQQELYVNASLYTLNEMLQDAAKNGFKVITIDNFQLITDGIGRDQKDKLVYLSQTLMRARNQGLFIFLLSQGNADGTSYGSTQVQKDADLCVLIDEKYKKEDKKKVVVPGIRTLEVIRSRFSGTGICDVLFQPEFSRVRTLAEKPKDPNADNFVEFEQYELKAMEEEDE